MTPAGEILRDEIRREGPIPFHRFMDVALYHPEYGYYRRERDPFGRAGDFYTAEQVQPVFGILIARRFAGLYREMGEPGDFTVVELGPGRREMEPAFAQWRYVPVEIASGTVPDRFRGVVFSNEFFDALPVDVALYTSGGFREMRVGWNGGFVWTPGGPVPAGTTEWLRRYGGEPEEGRIYEASLEATRWIERIARSLEAGFVFTIDYGYTRRESARFPQGTLMSYRRHTAREDVLRDPGLQDITAHVNFTALEEHGAALGLQHVRFESLAQALVAAGERDHFAAALDAPTPQEQVRRRQQLKTLLFGMGETFRVLLQRRAENEKGSERIGAL